MMLGIKPRMLGICKVIWSLLICKLDKCILTWRIPSLLKLKGNHTLLCSSPSTHCFTAFFFLIKVDAVSDGSENLINAVGSLLQKHVLTYPHICTLTVAGTGLLPHWKPLLCVFCLCLDFCPMHAMSSIPKLSFPQSPTEMSWPPEAFCFPPSY